MRILQVSPKYFPFFGGVEEHVRNIAERLAKRHEVTVFATDEQGSLPKEEEISGVLVRRFRSFAPGDAYHFSLAMWRELKRVRFDIVHGHSYHTLPLYLSKYARCAKYVVTPHYEGHAGTRFRDFLLKLYKPFGKGIFEAADTIIAVSKYERELLLRDFKFDEAKIRLIPNGINSSEFAKVRGVKKKERVILYAGRLEKYKGVQYLISALPLLEGFSLEIVGRGSYKPSLLEQVKRLKLKERVNFYQNLSREELLCKLAEASVFVLLSRYECFSIAVAEALAAGTPCIVALTSALKEWVDGRNCFGISYPINPAELASLISAVSGKRVSGVRLWDWDDVVAELENVYRL